MSAGRHRRPFAIDTAGQVAALFAGGCILAAGALVCWLAVRWSS